MAAKKAATRKTTTTTVEESPDEREELDAFDRARLEFSGEPGVKLTVYRYDDGETAYLKRIAYDPGTIDEEWIRKKWGAGSYQLRFTDEDGTRHWSKVVTIAADVSPAASSPSSAASSSSERELFETLRRQNEIMLQGLLARLAVPSGAPSSGGNEALVKLIEGLSNQNTELLRASLNRPDASSTILAVLERGMSLAAEHQMDAEGGWMAQVARMAKELLPAISEMSKIRADAEARHLAVIKAGPGMPTNVPPALPAGPMTPAPATAPTNGDPRTPSPPASPGMPDLDDLIRNFSGPILEAIQNGAPAKDLADNMLGWIPSAIWDVFEDLTPDRAIRIAPALSQHRGYVEELVRHLKDANADSDEDQEEEPS